MRNAQVLKGKLSIGRRSGGSHEEDYMVIEVTDESSGCLAIEVKADLKSFMEALTAFGYRPCEFELNTSGNVGKKREHKTEIIPIPKDLSYDTKERKQQLADAIKFYEVDGWKGNPDDLDNHHRWVKGTGGRKAEVGFFRYV